MGEPESRRRRALPDELADGLRRRITSGELHPGDRLPPERELAEGLSVNRGSVREALKKLEQLRLVEPQQGSGTRVLDAQHASLELVNESLRDDPTGGWARDWLQVRAWVAGTALRAALDAARPDAIADLERALTALADEDLDELPFLEALWGLPAYAARLSGNRVLILLVNALQRFGAEPRIAAAARQAVALERSTARGSLRRVRLAVTARDGASAELMIRDTFRRIDQQILAVLESPLTGSVDRDVGPAS
jgi:GntR family transcriptional repressor for pyruvate dehydrogenase complex